VMGVAVLQAHGGGVAYKMDAVAAPGELESELGADDPATAV